MTFDNQEKIISCTGLWKKFGQMPALSEVSVNIYSGRVVGLTGAGGSGKSTFLRLAAGQLRPTCGELTVCGEKVGSETKALTAFLPDRDILPHEMTVSELTAFYARFFSDFNFRKALRLFGELSIDVSKRFGQFSESRRAVIQTLLIMSRGARLFLLDEPFRGTDDRTAALILDLAANECDSAVVISTARLDIAEHIFDDIFLLQFGTVRFYGSAEDFRAKFGCGAGEYLAEIGR